MKHSFRIVWGHLLVAIVLAAISPMVQAQTEEQAGDLAKAAQNPVADLISLPLQNNTFFGIGPDDDTANVLNIQPVIPFKLSPDWNLITRTIAPLIYVPGLTSGLRDLPEGEESDDDHTFGLGDLNLTLFASPAKPGKFIWGIGPSLTLPTATDDQIGAEKWSAGPSLVVLATPPPRVVGLTSRPPFCEKWAWHRSTELSICPHQFSQ